ncbi:hypothetical protein AMECASPLE_009800 [Ameca splendens]|uniref:Uncharacterized protein n=1 Tax=Ameca splendens TaxID=208324 RepID=A0ABV1A7Q4_9TELE
MTKFNYSSYLSQFRNAERKCEDDLSRLQEENRRGGSPEPPEDADPVVLAIRSGDVETLNDLAASSSLSLLKENNNGWLPLHEAAYSGQTDCLRTLLKGKDILHLNPIFNLFSSSLTLRTALIRGRRS